MTKSKKNLIISAVCLIAIVLTALAVFAGVSHFYYHRSFSASIYEMKIGLSDMDEAFETQEGFTQLYTQAKNKQLSDEAYVIPEDVKLSVSAQSKEKHGIQVFYLAKEKLSESDSVIFYFYGGEFLSEISKDHWKLIDTIAKETGLPVIVPLYPTLPRYTAKDANEVLTALYKDTAKKKNIEHIYFVGDSSGGNLTLSLAKTLRDEKVTQPEKLIMIAPWLEMTMKNKDIAAIEKKDNVLGIYGLKELGDMWSGKMAKTNAIVSPVYSTDENLGEITIFAPTNDILYPDTLSYSESLTAQKIEHSFITRENLSHNYIFYPSAEAKQDIAAICKEITE